MASSRLLVVMPTRGYAYVPSVLHASAIARRFGRELVVEMGRPVELIRTRVARRFLDSGTDYLLTVDDDIVAPEDAVDRLLALDAAVACAPVPLALNNRIVASLKAVGADDWMQAPPPGVSVVGQTGLGFALIRRDVFARIRTPWFQFGAAAGGRTIGEDVWFSNGVTQAGLEIVCDGSVPCSHFKDGIDLLKLARW